MLSDDAKWAAVVARDRQWDGQFIVSVTSTGIYCKPSCPSRQPKRTNVRFHKTCADAEAAGFRACKRCQPNDTSGLHLHADTVAEACRIIRDADQPPSLTALANAVGLSAHHFHRVFKAIVGVTPKAFAMTVRENNVKHRLKTSETVTAALYSAGFNSSGRFYAAAPQMLGMSASAYRNGGSDETILFAVGQSSLGAILVAESEVGICAILMDDDAEVLVKDLQDRFPNASLIGGDRGFEQKIATVVGFVENPKVGLALPLDVRGTVFQTKVWQELQKIPPGTTASYAEIAAKLGKPNAVRAVAGACAANLIAVAIPCHRVVRSDGALSGYRWGIERKEALLEREKG
jgi:AraC family transcriptional regulator, regulatory protein of adaptative response / methylated-DNA-[protein]-cysteine methyltransferase